MPDTVDRCPGEAELAIDGAWASMKSSLGNHAATTLDELEVMVRSRLRGIQRRPSLINAFLGQTALTSNHCRPSEQTLAFQPP